MDKYNQAIADSQVITDDAQVAAKVNEILEKHLEENRTPEVLRQLFNCIDLTTLKSTDSQQSVANFTERVNAFEQEHPEPAQRSRHMRLPQLRAYRAHRA